MTQPRLFEIPPASPQSGTTTFIDNMKLPVHRWFRYSAGYSAGWVQEVLSEHSSGRVLDPFAGSGTTLLAAQSAGMLSIGLEPHPFVARVATAKLDWQEDPDDLRGAAATVASHVEPAATSDLPPLLSKCFYPDQASELLGIRNEILRLDQALGVNRLLWLAFVSVIRSTSHVGTAQWQYVLPNKRKASVTRPLHAFLQQVELMAADMADRAMSLGPAPAGAKILQSDARTCAGVEDGWATLVVCSPPYANNYDYADATRLEQTVLGEVGSWADLKDVRSQLLHSCSQHMNGYAVSEALDDAVLGPILPELKSTYDELAELRETRRGKKAYDSMIVAYFRDMANTLRALRRTCADGASVCFVVGDSAPYGVHVPVERWLGDLAVAAGFKRWRFEKVRDRNTKWKNRKHRVPLQEGRLWIDG